MFSRSGDISLEKIDANLPGLVDIADHSHRVKTIEEVDDHEDKDDGPDTLAPFCLMAVEEFHHGLVAEVHEECNDRGEAEACEKACVAGQVKRKTSVIPIVETAELFDQETESDLSKRNEEKYDGEVKEEVTFFRGADQKVHADDSDAVAEQKRQGHVAVIDKATSGEHPDIFDDKTEK